MKAIRILLAIAAAGATFYSLNAFAVKNGYPDRLDFRNRHYQADCNHRPSRTHLLRQHYRGTVDTSLKATDSVNLNK